MVQSLQNNYNVDPKRLTAGGRGEYNPLTAKHYLRIMKLLIKNMESLRCKLIVPGYPVPIKPTALVGLITNIICSKTAGE